MHVPVVHKGFLDFLKRVKEKVDDIYIIEESFLPGLTEFKPDIASIDAKTAKEVLEKFGFENIYILSKENTRELNGKEIILVNDEVSRNLREKYLADAKVEWESVFLRWGKDIVLVQKILEDIPTSTEKFDIEIMKLAMGESEKSTEWWRRIGAVLVEGEAKTLLKANNKDLPSDYTPYQVGEVRDLFNTGERPDLAHTIHAEQSIIAQAAKRGVAIEGMSLYVTTFPCPVCAKLIACAGIKSVYFSGGWSNFDARKILEAAGVKITQVPI